MADLRFSRDVKFSLATAADCAKELNHTYIGTEHLLLGLLRAVPTLFPGERAIEELEDRVYALVGPPTRRKATRYDEKLAYTSLTKSALSSAQQHASRDGAAIVDTKHLLSALVADKGRAGSILRQAGFQWNWPAKQVTDSGSEDAALQLFRVHDESEIPYYEQIVEQVREAVALGELNPGDRLPSVRRLADHLGLAPGTVARAFALLEQDHVIETAGPKGTTVASPKHRSAGSAQDRITELAGLLRPTVVAAFHMGGTAEELSEALNVAVAGVFDDPLAYDQGSG